MERLKVLTRDRFLLAVHKPAGILVYGEPTGCKELLESQLGQILFPVHRLDKETCGIVLFALDRQTAADLIKAFASHRVSKHYLAVVHGEAPERGTIRTPLPKHKSPKNSPVQTESARTDFERFFVASAEGLTFSGLHVKPKTGRHHQIRRHLSGDGLPIVWDQVYGKLKPDREFTRIFGRTQMLLCAEALELEHPRTKKILSVKTRPDEAFQKILDRLRRSAT